MARGSNQTRRWVRNGRKSRKRSGELGFPLCTDLLCTDLLAHPLNFPVRIQVGRKNPRSPAAGHAQGLQHSRVPAQPHGRPSARFLSLFAARVPLAAPWKLVVPWKNTSA